MVESVSESMHQAEEALAPSIDEMVHNAELLARMDARTLPDVDSPVRSAAVFLLVR